MAAIPKPRFPRYYFKWMAALFNHHPGCFQAQTFDSALEQGIRHAYPDKTALLRAFIAYQRELTDEWIRGVEAASADPSAQLRRYIDEWARSIDDARAPFCICALLAAELPLLPHEAAMELRAYFRLLSAWVASVMGHGAAEGSIRLAFPLETETRIFMATVQGAMLSARAYGEAAVFVTITAAQLARL